MSRLFACAFLFSFISASVAHSQTSPSAPKGNGFNPDISVNALGLFQYSNRGRENWEADRNGLSLQEAEMQFAADVDPYWRFVGTFSLSESVSVDKTTTPPTRTSAYTFEPEEAFAETLELPFFTLRVGKFKAALGRHNQLHTHAFPFIDAPLQNQYLLGDEGLNDVGLSASALVPLPWFSEFTLQAFSGQANGLDYFQSPDASNLVGLVHWRNLWDLTDEATFEMGVSAATGENTFRSSTDIYGSDLTFKWRRDKTRAFIWSAELLKRDRGDVGATEVGQGAATWAQYQFAERWWVETRAEVFEIKNAVAPVAGTDPIMPFQRKQSALLAFVPSEFSDLRLQYDHLNDGNRIPEDKVMLQVNYTIGAHPAHAY